LDRKIKVIIGGLSGVGLLVFAWLYTTGYIPDVRAISAFKEQESPAQEASSEVVSGEEPKEQMSIMADGSEDSKAAMTSAVEDSEIDILTNTDVAKLAAERKTVLPDEIILDVPLLKQMDAPRLYNGCEVTSLAMLLNYYKIMVTKNDLADKISRVPLKYGDGKNGNPNVGFVGNMEDGPGLGVYHEPIFKLAQSYAVGFTVTDLTKQPFSVLLEKVGQGSPVWIITTASFSPTSEMRTWNTPQGPVDVTYKMHSVVITGYDQDSIYINDPYGFKNRKVDRENFIKAWEQMGSQAVVVE
jgi:uncharacterized protein YvpB